MSILQALLLSNLCQYWHSYVPEGRTQQGHVQPASMVGRQQTLSNAFQKPPPLFKMRLLITDASIQ